MCEFKGMRERMCAAAADCVEGTLDGDDAWAILAEAHTSYTTASLEVRLLSDFLHVFTCENNSPGGESASGGSPHFCYVVVRCNGLLRRRGRGR